MSLYVVFVFCNTFVVQCCVFCLALALLVLLLPLVRVVVHLLMHLALFFIFLFGCECLCLLSVCLTDLFEQYGLFMLKFTC